MIVPSVFYDPINHPFGNGLYHPFLVIRMVYGSVLSTSIDMVFIAFLWNLSFSHSKIPHLHVLHLQCHLPQPRLRHQGMVLAMSQLLLGGCDNLQRQIGEVQQGPGPGWRYQGALGGRLGLKACGNMVCEYIEYDVHWMRYQENDVQCEYIEDNAHMNIHCSAIDVWVVSLMRIADTRWLIQIRQQKVSFLGALRKRMGG